MSLVLRENPAAASLRPHVTAMRDVLTELKEICAGGEVRGRQFPQRVRDAELCGLASGLMSGLEAAPLPLMVVSPGLILAPAVAGGLNGLVQGGARAREEERRLEQDRVQRAAVLLQDFRNNMDSIRAGVRRARRFLRDHNCDADYLVRLETRIKDLVQMINDSDVTRLQRLQQVTAKCARVLGDLEVKAERLEHDVSTRRISSAPKSISSAPKTQTMAISGRSDSSH